MRAAACDSLHAQVGPVLVATAGLVTARDQQQSNQLLLLTSGDLAASYAPGLTPGKRPTSSTPPVVYKDPKFF